MTSDKAATVGALDAVTMEILFNALRSVTDETFIALMRSAYSTNIKERRDHSTAICDPGGRLIVQAEHSLPIHLASMIGMMASLRAKVPLDEIAEGDIFVANDPHAAGGTHLPDINMAMPVFVDGKLVAFVCNIAHHADVGGMAPGSMAGGMSEIYQEGMRIPVVRLFRKGELQRDILDLLLLNVRLPEERRGDYYAQIAACRLGARRLAEIAGQYGIAVVERGFDDIIARTGTSYAECRGGRSGRDIPFRGRDGRRRPWRGRHSDPARGHRGGRPHPLRLHRHGGAGARQYQRHAQRDPGIRLLFAEGAARSRGAEQPGGARRLRDRDRARHACSTAFRRRRSPRAPIPASASSTSSSAH